MARLAIVPDLNVVVYTIYVGTANAITAALENKDKNMTEISLEVLYRMIIAWEHAKML